ncbi:extracellular solute-binding protein [Marispirochaeta sp.]|uniref:ABC transporter substrate-binding protein n=1 Tax=Marispirochaeta sp. TaxID=2038653 RepID=UPI0029C81C2A|nr:extracellular solute-binding protein [Marispirochaeta sp.]
MKNLLILALITISFTAAAFASGASEGDGAQNGSKEIMTAMFLGSSQDQAVVDIIKEVTADFNANNPYNVEFRIETYENEQYKTKLTTAMVSNSVPDVFFTWSAGYLQPFIEGGKVLPLDTFLDADSEWTSRFNEGVFGPVTYYNSVYAVPHGMTVAAVFYNKEIFDKLGLSVPESYDEFKSVCDTLNENGIAPISVPVRDAWVAGQFLQQLTNGVGGLDTFNGTKAGTVKWNDASYVKAGKLLNELVDINAFPSGYLGMTYDEGRALFISGEAAMFYMGSWEVSPLSDDSLPIAGKIGVFNLPPMNPNTGNVALGDVDQCLAVSAKTKNAEAAVAYIKLFSDIKAQEAYAYNANYLLSTKTQLDSGKLSPLFLEISNFQQDLTGVTPWLDRVFGAGEGVEFNNAAQAIIAGMDPQEKLDVLQQFAEVNATR